jgi:ABC-2 type transport system permease protein
MFPRFETENAADISTGFGGLLFMMTAVAYLVAIIMAEAWPVYSVLQARARGVALTTSQLVALALGLGVAASISAFAIALPLREARRRIELLDQ